MPKSLPEWLSYLGSPHPKAMDLGLERVTRVADRLNLRTFHCPVITVGGTNGKGSTVSFLSSIYQQAGYRVGAYTSPHLLSFNERICVNDHPVSDDDLCLAFQAIEEARGQVTLTYFEIATLAALYLFQKASLDVVILEVGLGGRLDAVNCVDADVAVITTISLDHTDWLGPDRDSIAREKAGILRPGKPAICGDLHPPEVLLRQARALGAPLYVSSRDFSDEEVGETWTWKQGKQIYSNLPKPHLPLQNAATALSALTALQTALPVSDAAIKKGLQLAYLQGRFQTIRQAPQVIIDVAHNPESGAYLASRLKNASTVQTPPTLTLPHRGGGDKSGTLLEGGGDKKDAFSLSGEGKQNCPFSLSGEGEQNCPPSPCGRGLGGGVRKTYAIVAMLEDKDQENTLAPLLSVVDIWFVAPLFVPRGGNGERLYNFLSRMGSTAYRCANVAQAYTDALQQANPNDRIIVFGSFYTVSAVLQG